MIETVTSHHRETNDDKTLPTLKFLPYNNICILLLLLLLLLTALPVFWCIRDCQRLLLLKQVNISY